MHFHVITLFPEMIEQSLSIGVVGQALKDKRVQLTTINPREFTNDAHHSVDDRPFGGGDGMIMLGETLRASVAALRERGAGPKAKVVHLSPRGVPLDDTIVRRLAQSLNEISTPDAGHLILIASRYGGVDQRFLNEFVDQEISVGDYILTGGELPALVLMDALSRHSKGVVGNESSIELESFADGLLEYPQFTRPREWAQTSVPAALLSGNHEKIEQWQAELSLLVTIDRRPDLVSPENLPNIKVRGQPLSRKFVEAAKKTWVAMTAEERQVCGFDVSNRLSLPLDEIIILLPDDSPKRRRS